jgi:Lon protease-like protein
VLERHEDGRLDILSRGTRPFRLVESHDNLPYPAGTVEWLPDKKEAPDAVTVAAAHEAYARLVVEATDAEPEPERVDAMTAYAMAATVDFGLEAKQGLLGLRSENARLRLVTRLLRAALKRLDFIERAQARARSNGKVRFG